MRTKRSQRDMPVMGGWYGDVEVTLPLPDERFEILIETMERMQDYSVGKDSLAATLRAEFICRFMRIPDRFDRNGVTFSFDTEAEAAEFRQANPLTRQ